MKETTRILLSRIILFLVLAMPVSSAVCAGTLTLDEAIRMALEFHPALKSGRAAVEAAARSRRAVAAKRWLRADFAAQAERHSDPVAVLPIKGWGQFPDFSRDIYSWEVVFSLPVYEGGRISKEVRLKELDGALEESMLRQSADDLVANVKQLFFQILYLRQLRDTQQKIVEVLHRQRDDVELKSRLGRVAKLDLLYMERALEEQQAILEATAENLALARRTLGLLIGVEPLEWELSGDLCKQGREPDTDDIEGYLSSRPDVKAAELKVKQAATALDRAKRAYLPSVSLFSSYGRRAGAGLHGDEEVWTTGLRMDLNLFDSGGKRSRVQQGEAALAAAKEELRAVQLGGRQEILSALSRIRSAKAQVERYKAAERYAREAYEVESIRYETGAGSVNDLLSAQEAWLRSSTALVKAYYDLKSALVAFELATGRIWGG